MQPTFAVAGCREASRLIVYNPITNLFDEIAVIIKILIIVFLLTILYSLVSSLIFLVRDHGEGDRTVKRLTWRIGLSLVLFVLLWVAHQMGWIEPNEGPVRPQAQDQAASQE